jgi:MerR family redox-sensitive transcriptional activator SoxR
MTISQLARLGGVAASAIRYYERIGLLPKAIRQGGQRRFDRAALYRLAIIRRAQSCGFSLEEMRGLFFGFRRSLSASDRWREMSGRKLQELEESRRHIEEMQDLLRRIARHCRCETLEQCGRMMLERDAAEARTGSRRVGRGGRRRSIGTASVAALRPSRRPRP